MSVLSKFAATSSYNPSLATHTAEAVDFDGTNDYLSRASDFTGNADGKTFTFSCWVDTNQVGAIGYVYSAYATGVPGFFVRLASSSGQLSVIGYNASGVSILNALVTSPAEITKGSFIHLLVSIDLANTSNRYMYINDTQATVTWNTYTNDSINFTVAAHQISSRDSGSDKFKGRLSHVFLDYTYRDLSVTANRRLFITADRKPAVGQAALNPIAYFKMDDPTTCHINSGTGGNMVLNGTVARSGRGPNQGDVAYSDLNGSTQYLSRASALTGIADGKQATVSFNISPSDVSSTTQYILLFATSGQPYFEVYLNTNTLKIKGTNSAGSIVLNCSVSASFVIGRNYHVVLSFDLANSLNRNVAINGAVAVPTWTTYTNDNIRFSITSSPFYNVGRSYGASNWYSGKLGDLYFDTRYIDLSAPANLAKFVTGTGIDAKPVSIGANGELPTGSIPLIYLPMYGNNAGKNYGSGGDFTVNAGPFPGARGPNEYWGNKATFDGSSGYFSKSSVTGVTDSKTFSLSLWASIAGMGGTNYILYVGGYPEKLLLTNNGGTAWTLQARDSSGTTILYASFPFTGGWIHASMDLTNTSNRSVYVNGVAVSVTWSTYTNSTIPLSGKEFDIASSQGSTFWTGSISELYFTTSYIDFSLESNRLKFRDAYGSPYLSAAITSGSIPNPCIYMRFPPDNKGKNYGTGGDFVVNGTITDGGQL